MRAVHCVVLAWSLALAGCYELAEPIFDKGAYAPIAGRFVCKGMFKQGPESFSETKTGVIFPDYRYTASDGSELTLKSLGKQFFAAQIRTQNKPAGVVFFDMPEKDRLLVLIADLMGKGPYIESLAKKFSVTAGPSHANPGVVRLGGAKGNVAAFIEAHEKGFLTVVMDCARASS